MLDAAILKRLGRFDRVVAFHTPSRDLSADYLRHLSRGAFDPESLETITGEAEGLSFAQLRESYIFAGHLTIEAGASVLIEHLQAGFVAVRNQSSATKHSAEVCNVGFTAKGILEFVRGGWKSIFGR